MKIDFEGQVRTLDLEHVSLRHAVAIQEYTGQPLFAWQERLSGFSGATEDDAGAPGALRKASMYTDPAWIVSVAAGHWLMLAQAGEGPPPLDDGYDCDVTGFYLALLTAALDGVRAAAAAPKARRPARRTPSSRQTAAQGAAPEAAPLPSTGS